MTGTLTPFSTVLAVAARGTLCHLIRYDGNARAVRNAAAAVASDRVHARERSRYEQSDGTTGRGSRPAS